MENQRGKFIVLEGIDASGKDTQEKLLKEHFPDFVFFHCLDEEKKHTNTLRDAMFNCGYRWATLSEMMMFWADKFQMIEQIKKLLVEGKSVVVNRWEVSNLAYQIWGKQREDMREWAEFMCAKLDEIVKPDLYLYFDVTVEESGKRMSARKGLGYDRNDYYESQKKDFFERVISGYKKELGKYNSVIIDGMQTREKVFEDTLKAIQNIL
jgi:dTMP kinase